MSIDVKAAVIAAKGYLQSIRDLLGEFREVRLEEVELSEDKRFWLVTLGFDRPVKTLASEFFPTVSDSVPSAIKREYKLIKVDSETGEVQSMKIREV